MTLANAYSWSPVNKRVRVAYEPPMGRRVNAVGALFHSSRRFAFATRARAPQPKRKAVSSLAAGLEPSELGTLDAEFLIGFIWRMAGRPEEEAGRPEEEAGRPEEASDRVSEQWRREKPLVIVLDNYSVHKSVRFQQERHRWQAADIDLFFLPSYSPELSGIEPLWRDVKQHGMRQLSRSSLLELKRDVDAVLTAKAARAARGSSDTNLTETA